MYINMVSKLKIAAIFSIALMAVACGDGGSKKANKLEVPDAVLVTQSDSLSYIIGVSMAQNILKVDPEINLAVVAAAIAHCGDTTALFTPDDARSTYLRYILHIEPERRRGYEDQYLKELAESDRSYTRTKSGITYNISNIGTAALIARNNADWVELNYTISRLDGEEIFSTYVIEEPLKSGVLDLPKGIQECVRLIGKGGKLSALIPSKLAFDMDGNEELGVVPYETLRYDIEVLEVEKNGASKHTVERDPKTF